MWRKILCFVFAAVAAVILSACSPKMPEHYVAFYLESPNRSGIVDFQRSFMLPVIEKEVRTGRDPVFNIDSLSDCVVSERVDAELGVSSIGLFFRVKDETAVRMRQISAGAEGRRLILVADGQPLGFCVISRNFTRNDLFFYIMTSAKGQEARDQIEELCFRLNTFILEFREYKEQN